MQQHGNVFQQLDEETGLRLTKARSLIVKYAKQLHVC